jgi:hypothetical protein
MTGIISESPATFYFRFQTNTMNEQLLTKDISEVLSAVHYRPSISILMPFGEKGDLRQNLVQSLDLAADRVERELNTQYPKEIVEPLMKRLRLIIEKLDINHKKKSIAIFLSPVFEKVVFLDIAVEEKVIIDESFEIRDLVYSRKQINKYLVLLLSSRESRIFLGNAHDFARIKLDIPEWAGAYRNDAPERVANFSDTKERKAVLRDKFLHQIDLALDPLLRNFKVPLFVLGTESVLGHFKKLSHHTHSVAGYIQGNYDGKSGIELRKILQPALEWYDKARQTLLMKRIDEAAGQKKLTGGIHSVWKEAMNNNGKLLLVEKNYMYAAQKSQNGTISPVEGNFSSIRDAVDDLIEKVLETGGDVEFTDAGSLDKYNHIALITYH